MSFFGSSRLAFLASLVGMFAIVASAQAQPVPGSAPGTKASAKASGAERISPDVAIQKANAYLNGATTLVADFVQVGGDGRRSEGKLYVQRPGRLRFEYAQPATLEVVADGTSVAIRDRKLATQDMYFINQTPLKFLLKDRIDLKRDVKILGVSEDRAGVVISIEDKATFGGTSHIKLIFDSKTFALKQWHVTDPQGYETLVSLFNVDLSQAPDPSLFRINNERLLNPN